MNRNSFVVYTYIKNKVQILMFLLVYLLNVLMWDTVLKYLLKRYSFNNVNCSACCVQVKLISDLNIVYSSISTYRMKFNIFVVSRFECWWIFFSCCVYHFKKPHTYLNIVERASQNDFNQWQNEIFWDFVKIGAINIYLI